jgi:two-component system, OmpR family, phosphate regulon response regulator OmpR
MDARIDIPDHAPHVLVVDDDRRLRDLLTRFLTENGYRVTAAGSAAEARAKAGNFVFDALVLDVMMPGETGFESDRVTGLEIGADDYLSKPFEPRELLLRLGNILKRAVPVPGALSGDAPETVHFGPFSYRFDRGELRRGDEVVRITEREREILTILGTQAGGHVPREALAGNGIAANERTVDVQINRLRRKIETDPANPLFLQTVRGIGYRLVTDR